MINFSEITEQKISEKYEGLPQDLKNVLSSVNTSTAIENIATKYHLSEEKITMLIQLVGLVIFGFANFNDMKEEMKETIDINPQFISLIADEIHQKIFLPVINYFQKIINVPMAPSIPPTPAAPAPMPTTVPPAPKPVLPAVPLTPQPAPTPVVPATKPITPAALRTDQYREPTGGGPEIIDLRKTPPPPIQIPVAAAPIPPSPLRSPALRGEGGLSPQPVISPIMPPATPRPISPLTFTKPIEKPLEPVSMPHLIEADPHKTPTLTPTLRPPVSEVGAPTPAERGVGVEADPHKILPPTPTPQYIIRPPGLAPTDMPRDVLDLRKDKGEF